MIKKSLFAEELAAGMQRELQPFEKKAATTSLVDAVDYLHSAVEIFEEAGMTAKADQVLAILAKIATHGTHVRQMPSMKALMEAGVTIKDIEGNKSDDKFATARLNRALRKLNLSDKEIAEFVGPNKVMSEDDIKMYLDPESSREKINDWFKDPAMPVDPMNPGKNEAIKFNSMTRTNPSGTSKPDEFTFKSLLASDEQPAKSKHVTDTHSKGLTSEKMLNNLKNHGTVFNMADDGKANDFLDLDINDAAMEVFDETPEDKTFEDSE